MNSHKTAQSKNMAKQRKALGAAQHVFQIARRSGFREPSLAQ